MDSLNEAFRKSLVEAVGEPNAAVALEAFDSAPSVSVRLNPFKPMVTEFGHGAVQVPWNPLAYILKERPSFTLDPAFHAGAYYVQDSSAMFVGYVVRRILALRDTGLQRPLRVLDLCAAPGGKTTDLAASLRQACGDAFLLVANEVIGQRAWTLADNVGKWGDPNVVVTSADPKAFAAMDGFFDIIVADVPCSGEGMFRKDSEAAAQWSEDNVALCEARQRRIVADVWPALADGGTMVYSTCTFNRRENDGNLRWVLENLAAEQFAMDINFDGVIRTEYGYVLVPGLVSGEGQYCAALRKAGQTHVREENARGMSRKAAFPKRQAASRRLDSPETWNGLFNTTMSLLQKNSTIVSVPENLEAEIGALECLRPLMKGIAVGEIKGKDLVPHADLALAANLSEDAFPAVSVGKETALAFLHKDPIVLKDAPKGLVVLAYEGLRLGFVKNLGNRCNNLLPQGRRIKMDI